MRFRSFFETVDSDDVPPAPGTLPIPPNSVRLYHYIQLRNGMGEQQAVQAVKQKGLDISQARGSTYGEPNCVWGSTQVPSRNHVFVEFAIPMGDPRWGIGKPRSQQDIDWLHKSGADVTLQGSVIPQEIMAIHLPWHGTYRYLEEHNMIPQVLSGEYNHLLENPDTAEAKAIQYIKSKHGNIAQKGV